MAELVNLGSLCIDKVYAVPDIVRPGETMLGQAPVRHAGGNESIQLPDRFELVRPLGAGGMSDVYLVRDQAGGELRALKRLRLWISIRGHAVIQVRRVVKMPSSSSAAQTARFKLPISIEPSIVRVPMGGSCCRTKSRHRRHPCARRAKHVRVAFNVAPVDGSEDHTHLMVSSSCC
jgi:hypothetical protein